MPFPTEATRRPRILLSLSSLLLIAFADGNMLAHSHPATGSVQDQQETARATNATNPAASTRLDVCDLSFLIPPGKYPISVSKEGEHGPILSRRLFDSLSDFKAKGHPGVANLYESMVITAFRFDPCGPAYPSDWDIKNPRCSQPNIRLIAQPYVNGALKTSALHMVFALGVKVYQDRNSIEKGIGFDPSVRDRAVAELKEMKLRNEKRGISTAGAPVGVHPAFAGKVDQEGAAAEFAGEFEQFVRRYALETSYFVTAVMYTVDPSSTADPKELEGKERWEWEKAFVLRFGKDGKPLPAPVLVLVPIPGISTADKPLFFQNLTADHDRRTGAVLSARSELAHGAIRNDDLTRLLKERGAIDKSDLQAGLDAADLMENPVSVLVQTEDCVSCHVTTTSRNYALNGALSTVLARNERFAFDASTVGLVSRLGDDAEASAVAEGYYVISLGYFKGKPSINQRTVFETVQAAYLINRNYP